MSINYALEPDEVAQGFVLACQAHPCSEKVVIDFDIK
jgi:ring-1,2-phenylacetyl-CoA epoxidase subunit PaaE